MTSKNAEVQTDLTAHGSFTLTIKMQLMLYIVASHTQAGNEPEAMRTYLIPHRVRVVFDDLCLLLGP